VPVAEYDDGLITCDDDALVISRYDMFLRPRRIPYRAIRSATRFEMTRWRGKWRIWGSGDLRHWFNYDRNRPNKQVAFVLDVGKKMLPVITPDKPEQVAAVLRKHGVEVEEAEA
jgi:hypothetical protein